MFDPPADEVWAVIRDFGHYNWAGIESDTHIEDGRAGDAVGCIRNVRTRDNVIRQRLLAHSDLERFYSYEFCTPIPFPVRNYQATLHILPLIDGNHCFVEWWAHFDCSKDEESHWIRYFSNNGFANWLQSLRKHLTG